MTAADEARARSAHAHACGCSLPFIAAPGWLLPFAHVAELGWDPHPSVVAIFEQLSPTLTARTGPAQPASWSTTTEARP